MDNVYYISSFKRNLILVGRLFEQFYNVSFDNKSIIIPRNIVNICSTNLENWLYALRPNNQLLLNTEMFKAEQPKYKKLKISHDNGTYLWHFRLGHINLHRINRLVKDGFLRELNVDTLPICESCLEHKMTKRPFSRKGERAKEPLESKYLDVCRPLNVQAWMYK